MEVMQQLSVSACLNDPKTQKNNNSRKIFLLQMKSIFQKLKIPFKNNAAMKTERYRKYDNTYRKLLA